MTVTGVRNETFENTNLFYSADSATNKTVANQWKYNPKIFFRINSELKVYNFLMNSS